MHDKNGTPLKKGDIVTITAKVTDLQAGEDFCNVTVETLAGRRPDGQKERFSAINTAVLVLQDRPEAEADKPVDSATDSAA